MKIIDFSQLIFSEPNFGGDMVFIGIHNCSSGKCEFKFFNEHRGYALSSRSTTWKSISIELLDNQSHKIVIERSMDFICGDPFQISHDTIRMLFVTYATSPMYSTLNEISNLMVKNTHLIEYFVPEISSCGTDAVCEDHYVDAILTDEPTQYFCKFLKLPEPNGTFSNQMIGYEPLTNDTDAILHHVMIYSCSGITQEEMIRHHEDSKLSEEYFKCGDYTMEYFQKCFTGVMLWIAGAPGFEFPSNVGYPINGDFSTDRYALMEVHFDNFPQKAKSTPTRAGVTLKYSKSKREFNAGYLMTGATWMFYLPPKQKDFSLRGTCSGSCLKAAKLNDTDEITIFAGMAHGHTHMTSLKLSKISENGEVTEVFTEKSYARMYQG